MMRHSIFNDVLGPIMAGPSSSHSAGCARIGRMTRLLWGKEIKKAVGVFDPVIPLDETILSMYEVGQMLPSELRCTCKGGLCNTKTAKCIVNCLERTTKSVGTEV